MLTPTALAFIGDGVHTLHVRRTAVENGRGAFTLHQSVSAIVNARAQAAVFDALESASVFSDEEGEIARRAKNAHLHSRAKAASCADYHKATALEAVLGYLYLTGQTERLQIVLAAADEVAMRQANIQ